jgi:hypothetical protein
MPESRAEMARWRASAQDRQGFLASAICFSLRKLLRLGKPPPMKTLL